MFCVFLRYDSDDVACQPFGSSLRLCVQWERNEKHSNHMKLTDFWQNVQFWITSMAWIGCQRRASARSPGEKPPEQGQVKAPRQQPSKTHCMSLTFNFAFERIRCSNALLGHSLLTILSLATNTRRIGDTSEAMALGVALFAKSVDSLS